MPASVIAARVDCTPSAQVSDDRARLVGRHRAELELEPAPADPRRARHVAARVDVARVHVEHQRVAERAGRHRARRGAAPPPVPRAPPPDGPLRPRRPTASRTRGRRPAPPRSEIPCGGARRRSSPSARSRRTRGRPSPRGRRRTRPSPARPDRPAPRPRRRCARPRTPRSCARRGCRRSPGRAGRAAPSPRRRETKGTPSSAATRLATFAASARPAGDGSGGHRLAPRSSSRPSSTQPMVPFFTATTGLGSPIFRTDSAPR